MEGPDYYIPAAAMGIALAFKLPGLARAWRDPLLRSVCALLALAGLVFFFAAPPTIATVNRITGVPNLSGPLVYSLLSAFSASCLVLIVNWRGGPPEQTRRVSRRWIAGYGVVIVALVVLFSLGEAPVERLRDLDTYYATTPYIREMITLYLVALTVAGVAMTVLCWRWSLQVRGWLRIGLLIIVVGYLFNLAYLVTKFAAVFARWAGRDWDGLSTDAAPVLASVGAQISAVGFCLPLVCQRLADVWGTWTTYRQLGPLWRELQPVTPRHARAVRIALWSPAELRVTQRESDIHDGMLSLYPYFSPEARASAYDAAVTAGSDPAQAQAEADAAMVTAAVRARAADPEGKIIDSAGAVTSVSTVRPRDLVRMSIALRQSPVVAAARGHAARPESDFHERAR
ncbi:MAB_1171c family putative transporter [Streptomyces sp. NPDC051219]|uniref:MAB_1171c family putative transporter n=1 Tax=Streptomyces sp. NPDC051219 TaxID=3155283 RepID=UPI0034150C99